MIKQFLLRRPWHAHYQTSGTGHLYQGRFKAFPVQTDEHFDTVLRYVERNALRAGLVDRAEDWRWSSLWPRVSGGLGQRPAMQERPRIRPAGTLSSGMDDRSCDG